ncbi:centrosomal and chromosomal factor-like [Chrysoperla carnea]|uniref:centrosomal and chromosomal factor-like n=1 Tax=Chrysoperla carnea TaxID=189513 RepID=UPI001D07259F|nr:centrosomal and chromosomal factor-like [Chrysoperla carnea]
MLYELALPSSTSTQQIQHHQNNSTTSNTRISSVQQKDYSRPLHVDCSVEYELPSQVKPPPSTNGKIDPLLMIHPCYFRKIEAQRRSPFINNLPGRGAASVVASTASSTSSTSSNSQNSSRSNRILVQQNTNLLRNTANTNTNLMYSQQQQQTTVPQYHHHHPHQIHPQNISTNTSNSRQPQWNTNLELHQFNKPTTIPSTVGTTKHLSSCAGGAAVSNIVTGMYNNASTIDGGGLWNTNHSPLAAERFPEPQVTLLHQLQHQPDQQSTHHHTTAGVGSSSSCKQSKHAISGKYRQYHLPTHRLHPYMSVAALAMGPQIAQMQQISCYNV